MHFSETKKTGFGSFILVLKRETYTNFANEFNNFVCQTWQVYLAPWDHKTSGRTQRTMEGYNYGHL